MECRLWPMNQILLQLNEIITSKEMGVKGDTWVILNSVLFGRCKVKSKDLATNMDTGWRLSHREQVSILIPVCCAQPHPTLFDPMDYSPPGFSVHGILQARVLEWVAISSSWGLPDPGIEPTSVCVSCVASKFFTRWATWEVPYQFSVCSPDLQAYVS